MIDLVHACAYLLPGVVYSLIAAVLGVAAHRANTHPASPAWTRWFARCAMVVLAVAAWGLLLFGTALAIVVLG